VYERDGKVFTTDIEISKRYDISKNKGFLVSFVIECKYKEKNHCWFFMEFQKGYLDDLFHLPNAVFGDFIDPVLTRMGYQLRDTDLIMGRLGLKEKNKNIGWRRFIRMNLFDSKVADKGVEILIKKKNGGNFDPNTITRAVSQAIHGAITIHGRRIDYVSLSIMRRFLQQKLHSYCVIGLMTVPIIITTAKLFRVKEGTSLEDIENASSVRDLFREERSVLLFGSRLSFKRFSEETFKEDNMQSFPKVIDFLGDSSIGDNPSFRYNFPSNVYVLNYEYLDDLFSLCLGKLERLSYEIVEEYEGQAIKSKK
jgi:hypothetical protein